METVSAIKNWGVSKLYIQQTWALVVFANVLNACVCIRELNLFVYVCMSDFFVLMCTSVLNMYTYVCACKSASTWQCQSTGLSVGICLYLYNCVHLYMHFYGCMMILCMHAYRSVCAWVYLFFVAVYICMFVCVHVLLHKFFVHLYL